MASGHAATYGSPCQDQHHGLAAEIVFFLAYCKATESGTSSTVRELGAEQRRDIRSALALAATARPPGEPLDWQHAVYPTRWRFADGDRTYDWVGPDGAGLP